MSFATIVFTDIVSFSRQKATEQKKLVKSFNQFIAEETQISSDDKLLQKDVIALPTGDGMALAFMQSQNSSEATQEIIEFCIKLHQWAFEHNIKLRIGVHYGAVHLIKDINGQPNICGDTINDTQRIMDGGGPAQLLFSADYCDQYIEDDLLTKWQPKCLQDTKTRLLFSETFDIIAKHDRIVGARQLHMHTGTELTLEDLGKLEPDALQAITPEFWSNADPEGKMRMQLNLTRMPRSINNDFGQKLYEAEDVALVLLTGENLIERLEKKEAVFGDKLSELIVLMPAEIGQSKTLDPNIYTEEFFAKLKTRWLTALTELKKERHKSSIKLGFFTEPPYFGASYLNWQREGGQIHISPYVWGTQTSANPAFDVRWVGKSKPPVYQAYVEGLRALSNSTSNELEKD